jgi:hypothetical protein
MRPGRAVVVHPGRGRDPGMGTVVFAAGQRMKQMALEQDLGPLVREEPAAVASPGNAAIDSSSLKLQTTQSLGRIN